LEVIKGKEGNEYLLLGNEADILMGLELGETYRANKYISSETRVVSNNRRIIQLSVTTG